MIEMAIIVNKDSVSKGESRRNLSVNVHMTQISCNLGATPITKNIGHWIIAWHDKSYTQA